MFQDGSVGLGRGPSNDDEGFFVSTYLFLPGGPIDYFITMFLLLFNKGLAFFVTDFCRLALFLEVWWVPFGGGPQGIALMLIGSVHP